MSVFVRNQGERGERAVSNNPSPQFVSEREIIAMLAQEMERSRRYKRPLSVVYLAPQMLPGELGHAAELDVVAPAIGGLLRSVDRVALLSERAYLAVLPETTTEQAASVAERLQMELTIRSAALNQRKWRAGTAGYPEGGLTPEALIETAERATRRRR